VNKKLDACLSVMYIVQLIMLMKLSDHVTVTAETASKWRAIIKWISQFFFDDKDACQMEKLDWNSWTRWWPASQCSPGCL